MMKCNSKQKCSLIDYADDYGKLGNAFNNPYYYNFGRIVRSNDESDYSRLHHVTNDLFFYKK